MDQRLITFQWRLLDRNPTKEGKCRLKCSDHRSPKKAGICVQSIPVYDHDRPRGNNVFFFLCRFPTLIFNVVFSMFIFNVDFQC